MDGWMDRWDRWMNVEVVQKPDSRKWMVESDNMYRMICASCMVCMYGMYVFP